MQLLPAMQSDALSAFGGASSPASDVTPAAYRSTTQSMITGGLSQAALGYVPQLQAEWAINIWARQANVPQDGYLFNLSASGQFANGNATIGGGTVEAIALYWSGTTSGSPSLQNRYSLAGVDKAGNKLSASTVNMSGWNGFGYMSEALEPMSGYGALLTVQYRAGNIELWATYKSMRPRLLIRQPCTFTGTSNPLEAVFGGARFGTSNLGLEIEMPIVIPDRSLSESEIAQLADGISPEVLGGATGKASAAIRFATITNGTTTTADTTLSKLPTDGQTITLNGDVYTFKTTPVLGTDIQIVPDIAVTTGGVSATTDTITATAHGKSNGQRTALVMASGQPGGTLATIGYYVVNATANTFQIALTSGGTPVDITSSNSASTTISGLPATLDNLATALNALTPNSGGASNATYVAAGSDILAITSRTANVTTFTFDTTATAKMPANKRLALAWVYITDYTAFRDGLFGTPGLVRNRGAAWITPTLGELAPNTQVTGSMRVVSWGSGMVAQHVAGIGNLALTGIYTGVKPSGLQVKITDLADNSIVQDWTTSAAFTVNTGALTWTAKLTVPKGKRWLGLQTRKLGSTQVSQRSEVRWGVGEVILMLGDSMTQLSTAMLGTVTPNGFISRFVGTGVILGTTSGYWNVDNAWHRFLTAAQTGSAEGALANKVSNDSNCVVGMMNRAVGGSSLAALTTTAVANAFLADLGNSFSDSSVNSPAGFFMWDQGLADSGSGYGAKLDTLYAWVRANFGSTIALGVSTLPNHRDPAPDYTDGIWKVHKEQIIWLAGKSGDPQVVDSGDDFYRSNTLDGTHYTDPTDGTYQGEIKALSMLKYRGVASFSGVGPTIASATRSGAVINVTLTHNGGTGLQVPNVADITGFDVTLASNTSAIRSAVTLNTGTSRINWTAHGLSAGDPTLIGAITTQPAGLTAGTTYFIINPTTNDFQLAATVGGTPITLTTTGTAVVAVSNKNLLAISSATILDATTVQITLAADPGGPVAINYLYGRPGRNATDPNPQLDTTGVTAMTSRSAQNNILYDNFALANSNVYAPGKAVRATPSPIVTPS